MFNKSIKHPKGRRMGAFDRFISDCLNLAYCRESPTSFIQRVQLARKDLPKKMNTGEEFRILSFDFYFRITLICL